MLWFFLAYLWMPWSAAVCRPAPGGREGPRWGSWSRLPSCCTKPLNCSTPEPGRGHTAPGGPLDPAVHNADRQVQLFFYMSNPLKNSHFKRKKTTTTILNTNLSDMILEICIHVCMVSVHVLNVKHGVSCKASCSGINRSTMIRALTS